MRDGEEGRARAGPGLVSRGWRCAGGRSLRWANLGFDLSFEGGCVKFGFFLGVASSGFGAFPEWEWW